LKTFGTGIANSTGALGSVTGALSGIVVIDFDGEHGRELMAKWG